MVTNTNKGLAKALRSRIGRACWFRHPETGEVIQGSYGKDGKDRLVKRIVGLKQFAPDKGRGFNIDEQTFTVPSHIRIHFGPLPANVVKATMPPVQDVPAQPVRSINDATWKDAALMEVGALKRTLEEVAAQSKAGTWLSTDRADALARQCGRLETTIRQIVEVARKPRPTRPVLMAKREKVLS